MQIFNHFSRCFIDPYMIRIRCGVFCSFVDMPRLYLIVLANLLVFISANALPSAVEETGEGGRLSTTSRPILRRNMTNDTWGARPIAMLCGSRAVCQNSQAAMSVWHVRHVWESPTLWYCTSGAYQYKRFSHLSVHTSQLNRFEIYGLHCSELKVPCFIEPSDMSAFCVHLFIEVGDKCSMHRICLNLVYGVSQIKPLSFSVWCVRNGLCRTL